MLPMDDPLNLTRKSTLFEKWLHKYISMITFKNIKITLLSLQKIIKQILYFTLKLKASQAIGKASDIEFYSTLLFK